MVHGSVRQAGVCLVVFGALFASACTTITRNSKTAESNPTQSGWVPDPSSPGAKAEVKSVDLQKVETVTAPSPQTAQAPVAVDPAKPTDVTGLLQTLNSRLDSMESKIGSLNDRVEVIAFQKEVESKAKVKKTAIPPPPAVETVGEKVAVTLGDDDPQAGFVQDAAVVLFREGSVALSAGKYDEAIVKFSQIVEKYAEHALAGSAQYYVGESYFRKGELKLAVQEFDRVLNAYDRSPHVSETLQRLVQIHQSQGMKADADRARQQLTSLFPQSPAAAAAENPGDPAKKADEQIQRVENEIKRVEKRLQGLQSEPTAADKDPAKEIAKELAKEGLKDSASQQKAVKPAEFAEPPPTSAQAPAHSTGSSKEFEAPPASNLNPQAKPLVSPKEMGNPPAGLEPPPTAPEPAPGAG